MPRKPALTLLLLAAGLAGCAQLDPFTREGVWRPSGANAHNLRAMVVVPSELHQGTAFTGTDGQVAGTAVDRLREDRVRPLPESAIGVLRVTGGGGGN